MRVLIVKPNVEPFAQDIDGGLKSMQDIVGGDIEATYPFDDSAAVLVCNEQGKLEGLPLNRPIYDSKGEIADIICGDFFIAGEGSEDFISLTDEQIEKYAKIFAVPNRQLNVKANVTGKDKSIREER